MPQTKNATILVRECVICGSPLKITLHQNRRYRGGHYFGKILPAKSKSEQEYWECDKCYER